MEIFKSNVWDIVNMFISGEINWMEVERRLNIVFDQFEKSIMSK